MAWRRLLQRLGNTMTKLVHRGWSKELIDALAADSSHVRIISPFIKESIIKNLLAHKPRKLQVITRFNLADCAAGVSDIAVLRELTQANAQVRGIKNLHAKLYVFGATRAIITSANLTDAGLNRNFELGTVSEDDALIRDCQKYFDDLWDRARDVQHQEINDWDREIEEWRSRGGRANDPKRLADYGADIGLEIPLHYDASAYISSADSAWIKFLGNSTDDRWSLTCTTLDAVKKSECHWALRYNANKGRPTGVLDGAVMFIGRFTQDGDVRVFGRAIAKKHDSDSDEATLEDIQRIGWRDVFRYLIRVHKAEFVAGTLENGVSRNELMNALGSDSFAPTQRHAKSGQGNTHPKRALSQQEAMELTSESHAWLEEYLQDAFKTHGKISEAELDTLYWPDPT